jgi:hypothetical protein
MKLGLFLFTLTLVQTRRKTVYTKLFARNLGNSVARVTISAGTATVIDRTGSIRTYTVSDETRLLEYCRKNDITVISHNPTLDADQPEEKPRQKLSEKAQTSLEKVVEKFQNGDLSAITHAVRLQLDPEAPARKWTLSNRVLAYAQTGELDCRGYRQWQAAGRQVKKGSCSAYILRPKTIKKTRTKADGSEEEYQRLIGFAPVAIFSVEDTEGEPLPSYEPAELPPLADVAQMLGIDVHYQPLPPGTWGSYSPGRDHIRLATHDEATFFHELAHAAHKRVEGQLKGGQDTHQETVAEFTAAVLMELYGIRDHTGSAWDYIAQDATDPLTAITKALATVEKVLACLLDS